MSIPRTGAETLRRAAALVDEQELLVAAIVRLSALIAKSKGRQR